MLSSEDLGPPVETYERVEGYSTHYKEGREREELAVEERDCGAGYNANVPLYMDFALH